MKTREREQKKQTNAQLERRIKRAVLHIDRTKDTDEIFFSDKGLRLIVNEDCCVIETGYHRHVFDRFTGAGGSRPYMYIKRFVEIALENDCQTDDGYSYAKLFEILKAKEDNTEYNICWFADKWMYNIFSPLYSIGESEAEAFLVYEDYMHNIARQSVILSEKTEDITNKAFIDKIFENEKEYTASIEEKVLFKKKSDEETVRENIDAIQEQEAIGVMEAQADDSKN